MVIIGRRGQYKIQQMAFMILAIFFFFVLVFLFFVGFQAANTERGFANLQQEKALSALKVVADSVELHCSDGEAWCIDRDKLVAFAEYSSLYDDYWGISFIGVLMVFPNENEGDPIYCPSAGCDYWVLYDSGDEQVEVYSAYVNVCERVDRSITHCELAKLLLGVRSDAI